MPREQINYPDRYETLPDGMSVDPNAAPRDRADEEPSLHVNWDNDGLVQVSINMTTDRIKRWSEHLNDAAVSHSAFYTPILTRTEINKLIRTLRIARDKAYGRDE